MKMKFYSLFVVLFFRLSFLVHGQTSENDITPPDPVSFQFQKFVGYPVSHSTGLADIDIPLASVTASGVTLPLSLKYHSSGIKVNQAMGPIGLGWSLFPGFKITRTIMGNPDDQSPTNDIRSVYSNYDFNYLFNITPRSPSDPSFDGPATKDGQYDIFTIHLPTVNATFILEWKSGSLVATTLPNAPIKITPVEKTSGQGDFYAFNVTDENGVIYKFGPSSYGPSNFTEFSGSNSTSWMLREIDPPGYNNSITFTYQNVSMQPTYFNRIYSMVVNDQPDLGCTSCTIDDMRIGGWESYKEYYIGSPSDYIPASYTTRVLDEINFSTGDRIDFTYSGTDKLSTIQTYNQNSDLVRTITFAQANEQLTSLEFSDGGVYSFEYDQQQILYLDGQDYFGYYNGKSNTNLIPQIEIEIQTGGYIAPYATQNMTVGFADRAPVESKMKARILKKINYPTGGYTSFDYEANKFLEDGVQKIGCGLRVRQVDSYDPVRNQTITKTYKYGTGESGYGMLSSSLNPYDGEAFITESFHIGKDDSFYCQSFRQRTISSMNNYGEFSFSLPIWYPEVTEYSSQGKTVFQYEYDATTFLPDELGRLTKRYNISYLKNIGTGGPRITKKFVKNSSNTTLEETVYGYSNDRRYLKGVIAWPNGYIYRNGYVVSYSQGTLCTQDDYLEGVNYWLEIRNDKLTSVNVKKIMNGVTMENLTTYQYDQSSNSPYSFNLKEKRTSTSDGQEIVEKFYYPVGTAVPDLAQLGSSQQSVISGLASANRLTTVLEKETYKNSTLMSKELYGYKYWGNSIYRPEQIYSKGSSGNFRTETKFLSYDNQGNLTAKIKGVNFQPSAYLWAYKQQYPVAIAQNASSSEIAYTSFEDSSNKGNWTYSGSPITSGSARTGKKYYYLNNGSISKSGFGGSSTNKFKLAFWARRSSGTGSWTFMGQTESLSTAWKLIEREVSTNSVSISGSGIYVDELRLYPADAQMVSYTYDPSVGITSKTDARNYTVFYDYDSSNKLKTIKDEDGKILDTYEYNYITEQ